MTGSGPTIAQLRALAALADTLNFRKAADQLGVSQPSVSTAISGLEAVLGTKVAERSSRKVALTRTGQEVAALAREVIDGLDSLVDVTKRARAPGAGSLRLGVIPTVAPYVLAPVLRTLARRSPELRPEVTEDQTARLVDRLGRGDLDAALLALPTGVSGLVEVALYWEEFVVVVPPGHSLAGRSGVRPEVLKDLHLLLLEEGHCFSGQVLDICQQVGAGVDHPARATSLTTVAQLVAAGLGETLLPATAVPVETRKGKLAVAHFGPPAPGRRIGLVYPAESPRRDQLHQVAGYLRQGLDRPGFAGRVEAPSAARAS